MTNPPDHFWDFMEDGDFSKFAEREQSERRCQKCGDPTGGEEAWVDGEIWCHPCADAAHKLS